MPLITTIIDRLTEIAEAEYQRPNDGSKSTRKTYHQKNFEQLQGSARNVLTMIAANNHEHNDGIENIHTQFDAMDKYIRGYCSKTPGTENVLLAFNHAQTAWQEFNLDQ